MWFLQLFLERGILPRMTELDRDPQGNQAKPCYQASRNSLNEVNHSPAPKTDSLFPSVTDLAPHLGQCWNTGGLGHKPS